MDNHQPILSLIPDTIKNVSSITLLTTQIPNNVYTFSRK